MDGFLGIDLGTGSAKAVVLDVEGRELGRGSAVYAVASPHPGWAEGSCEVWWAAVVSAVGAARSAAGVEIAAIGLSGQMHGVVLVDQAGDPVRAPILWPDTRATGALYAALPATERSALGNPFVPGMAGPILAWLGEYEPGTLRAARWALQPKDWLRFRLTGEAASDPSDASATLLWDVNTDAWSDAVVAHLGVARELLPPTHGSEEVAGTLTDAAASALHLSPGTPVATGAADTAASQIGTGLPALGHAQLTIGTGGQIAIPTGNRALPHPEGRTHAFRAATANGWYAMGAVQSAGLALERALALTGSTWDELHAALASVPAGARGVSFIPHVAGARSPRMDPAARAGWVGIGLEHDRADLLRAAGEGVAFTLRDALDALLPLGLAVNRVILAGGGTTDPAWRQLLADALERPLAPSPVSEASVRGAALLAAVAVDRIPSVAAAVRLAPDVDVVTHPATDLSPAYETFQRRQAALSAAG